MSIVEEKLLDCPKCNHQQNVKVWSSLNVSLNPEGRNYLFEGKINQFLCEECGYKTYIPVPFLYHDLDRKFAVHYFPPESMKKVDFLNQFDTNGRMIVTEDLGFEIPEHMLDVQVVFSMNELTSYVIFRELLLEHHLSNRTKN